MRLESFVRLEMDSGAEETVQETRIFGASLFLHEQSAFKTDLLKIGIFLIRRPFWNRSSQNCFSVISWKLPMTQATFRAKHRQSSSRQSSLEASRPRCCVLSFELNLWHLYFRGTSRPVPVLWVAYDTPIFFGPVCWIDSSCSGINPRLPAKCVLTRHVASHLHWAADDRTVRTFSRQGKSHSSRLRHGSQLIFHSPVSDVKLLFQGNGDPIRCVTSITSLVDAVKGDDPPLWHHEDLESQIGRSWRACAHLAANWYNIHYSPGNYMLQHDILATNVKLRCQIRSLRKHQARHDSQIASHTFTYVSWAPGFHQILHTTKTESRLGIRPPQAGEPSRSGNPLIAIGQVSQVQG